MHTPPNRRGPGSRGIVLPAAAIGVLLGVALLILLGSGGASRPHSAPVARTKPKPAASHAARKQRGQGRHRASADQPASTQTTAVPAPSPPAKALPLITPARQAMTVPRAQTATAPPASRTRRRGVPSAPVRRCCARPSASGSTPPGGGVGSRTWTRARIGRGERWPRRSFIQMARRGPETLGLTEPDCAAIVEVMGDCSRVLLVS
jgi:hypothetical protein